MGGLIVPSIMDNYVLSVADMVDPKPVFANMRYIGKTLDGKIQVILISELSNVDNSPFTGFVGDIYILRGHTSMNLVTTLVKAKCTYCYNQKQSFVEIDGVQKNGGKCTYNNKKYIGVEIGYSSTSNIFISGIYSKDCIFQAVDINDVQWEG